MHGELGVVGKLHAVSRFMKLPMMCTAEQHHSIDIGPAPIDPVIDVMYIAMFGFCSTPGRSTMPISGNNCSSLRWRCGADFSAQVQHLRIGHEHSLHD